MKTSPPNKAVPAGRGGKSVWPDNPASKGADYAVFRYAVNGFPAKGFQTGLFRNQDEEQAQAVEGLAFSASPNGRVPVGEGQVLVVKHEFHTFGFAVDLAVVKADEVDGVADAGAFQCFFDRTDERFGRALRFARQI